MNFRNFILVWMLTIPTVISAQTFSDLDDGLHADVEMSGTVASGDYAPLWLSSNKQGIVSAKNKSVYLRVGAFREIENDSLRTWKRGYGVDIYGAAGSQSHFMIHQLFAEFQYMKVKLTVGKKEREIDLRNNELTSGGMSLGINAEPIPQGIVDVQPFSFPGTHGWWKWNARFGFGMTTDGGWQKSFTNDTPGHKWNENHLYHEKALYWHFGKENATKCPLTYDIGIQMMTQFGGTSHWVAGRGIDYKEFPDGITVKHSTNLKAFIDAVFARGRDATDGTESNTAGNTLGSYNMRLAWHGKKDGKPNAWEVGAYFERFFEDQSYLTVQYGIFFDHLFGLDARLPKNPFVSNVVVEHLNTRNQSGAVYHDKTESIPDKMNGRDNYYRHNNYSGWQHYGMVLGHPFITSPIYNKNGEIEYTNSRVKAWHIGLSGNPSERLHWNIKMSFTENWGNYKTPFYKKELQQYYMAELCWKPEFKHKSTMTQGWQGKLALGYDHGGVLGNSFGAQITIHKSFQLAK